jgi:leucyl-tRNA synthetase
MHLLYARFWTKVLHDAGLVCMDEPFRRLRNQGMILDATGAKMAKSRPDHLVTPDAVVADRGADALRAYELFIAPFDQDVAWSEGGIAGMSRWLRRVWRIALRGVCDGGPDADAVRSQPGESGPAAAAATARRQPGESGPAADAVTVRALRRTTHAAIRDVTAALDGFRFNVAVARLMAFTNELSEASLPGASGPAALSKEAGAAAAWDEAIAALLRMLAPIAPHISEELWSRRSGPYSIHVQPWPSFDEAAAAEDTIEIAVQVNGVVRGRVHVPAGADGADLRARALCNPEVVERLRGRQPRRVIVVPGRLVNVVTD